MIHYTPTKTNKQSLQARDASERADRAVEPCGDRVSDLSITQTPECQRRRRLRRNRPGGILRFAESFIELHGPTAATLHARCASVSSCQNAHARRASGRVPLGITQFLRESEALIWLPRTPSVCPSVVDVVARARRILCAPVVQYRWYVSVCASINTRTIRVRARVFALCVWTFRDRKPNKVDGDDVALLLMCASFQARASALARLSS